MRNLANGPLKAGADPVSDAFRTRVIIRHNTECLVEPTFASMKALPAAQDFISHFNQALIFRKFEKKVQGSTSEKAILILDEKRRELGIIRWIRGEGEPFFINSFDKAEPVESVLAQVPEPAAPKAQPGQPQYRILASKTLGYGEFRIPDTQVQLEKVAREFRELAPGLTFWVLRDRFNALRALSEARDFIAAFKHTQLHYELAGKVETWLMERKTPEKTTIFQKRVLTEAAVLVLDESNQPVAVMRWVRGQGIGFFQNLLSDASQSVNAVLDSLKAPHEKPASPIRMGA